MSSESPPIKGGATKDGVTRRLDSARRRSSRPANLVTIGRLIAAPVLVVMVAVWGSTWAAVVVAFCVCSTDGLDGWIARRHGATTSGAFLDPLADKAVVVGTSRCSPREARSPGCRSRSSRRARSR